MAERKNIIGSDALLTEAQADIVAVLLNMIVAPSEDGRMPGAGQFDVLAYIREAASEVVPALREELDRLEEHAQASFGEKFVALAETDRQAVVDELRASERDFLHGLAAQTVACYYQQDQVLEAIGMEARPPYPKGYEVKPGDLSLLDPVRQRGKLFRDPAGD